MNLIRLTEGFTANLRFQVAAVEIFEDHRKTFEVGTDFRILRFVSQKTQSDRKKTQNR
jgi:hypothetical protein